MSELSPTVERVEAPPRRRWRRRHRLGLAVLLLAGAGVAYYYYASVDAERRLQKAIAKADRLDPSWTFAEIKARRKVIPDSQNAILLVMPAQKLQPVPATAITVRDEIELLPPQEQVDSRLLKSIRTELQRATKMVEGARAIADMPKSRYDPPLAPDVVSTPLGQCDALSTLLFYLLLDVAKRAQEQDAEGAFRSARAMFNSARALGDDYFAIVHVVRMVRGRYALNAIGRVLAQGQVSEATLTDFQRLVDEEEEYPGLLIAARGERAVIDMLMQRLETREVKSARLHKVLAMFEGRKLTRTGYDRVDDFLFAMPLSSIKANRAAVLDYLTEFVEIARLPLEEQHDAVVSLETRREDLPALARELVPLFFIKMAEHYRQSRAELRCASAALAAERFRLKHGRWPNSLAELVPGFLKKMPIDPYDSSPIRFRKLEHGCVIYALGSDLQDDGGNIGNMRMDRGGLQSQDGIDVGFRLWDVSHRYQPSTAGEAKASGGKAK